MLITHSLRGAVCPVGQLVADSGVAKKDTVKHKVKKQPLESKVDYSARDSIRLDATTRIVYLYGDAVVKYQDLELKAAYIEISMDSNIATARGVQDSGKTIGKPEFHQGGDTYNADEIRYNFKTKKGRINQIHTKEGEGYIFGNIVKKDSSGVFYIKNGTYSTCDNKADPHFFIGSTKLKVIPHDQVVTGPAWLVIEGVPTPLAIPFGFFPLTTGRHSGIIIPTYGESAEQGYFLNNGGYYLGLNDHFDMKMTGDIYTNGSWAGRDLITYDDRYHYHGNLQFAYSDTRLPVAESNALTSQSNFLINWQHAQDSKANPYSTFSASVNVASPNFLTTNSYNPSVFLQNTLQSNIAYTRNFPETPFHLALTAQHWENTISDSVNITLPQLTFTVDRFNPAKWFESNPASKNPLNNIGISANLIASNSVSTNASKLFDPNTLDNMKNGLNANIPLTAPFTIAKYFTLTYTLNNTLLTYFETSRESWTGKTDTVLTDHGTQSAWTYNTALALTTNVYAMYSLGVKRAVLIRQVFFPSITLAFQPDYSSATYGYYRYVQSSASDQQTRYSIFQQGIYGGPAAGKQGAVNWALGTNLEMKYRVHTDSGATYKKVKLLERFTVSGGYNFAADSFNLAKIQISGNTTLFKKLAINFNGVLDPYETNSLGNDIDSWNFSNSIGRLTQASVSFSTTLAPGTKKTNSNGTTTQGTNANGTTNVPGAGGTPTNNSAGSGVGFTSPDQYYSYEQMHPEFWAPLTIAPWSVTLYYTYGYSIIEFQKVITQSVMVNGSLQLSKFWYAAANTGYDFTSKQFTSVLLSARRDMHCWELEFSTIPFGFHQNFQLTVHVKAATLADLKLQRKRDWTDTQQYSSQ